MAAGGKSPPTSHISGHNPGHNSGVAAQLLLDLFEGRRHVLATPFEFWLTSSKPFTAFVQSYLSKIRKKVKMCRDDEECYDLYCELRTAYLLLQEPRLAVIYEAYPKQQGRSADFAVTFRTRIPFHVEVTRLRLPQQESHLSPNPAASPQIAQIEPAEQEGLLRRYASRRLTDVVCDKLGQLSPETPNLLWVWSESRLVQGLELGEVMVDLKRRAEQRDAALFARYHLEKPADLIRLYQRLSAILVQSPSEAGAEHSMLWWQNKGSRHSFPANVATAIRALVAADGSPRFKAGGRALDASQEDENLENEE